ncbi:MAG: hypothetical protein J2O48_03420 [Solirubrobacterales bacterium]|nr:hypothetical protein [Solirubrobacterales bacterium]
MSFATGAHARHGAAEPRQGRQGGPHLLAKPKTDAAAGETTSAAKEKVISVFAMQLTGLRSEAEATDPSGMRAEAVRATEAWCGPATGAMEGLEFACRQISRHNGHKDERSVSKRAAWRWLAVALSEIA